jgi:hypothetical protein
MLLDPDGNGCLLAGLRDHLSSILLLRQFSRKPGVVSCLESRIHGLFLAAKIKAATSRSTLNGGWQCALIGLRAGSTSRPRHTACGSGV